MATKPKSKKAAKAPAAKKATTSKTPKADKSSGPGIGHNYRVDRKIAQEHFAKLDRIFADKEESNAGYMADIGNAYEKAASALGIPEKIVKKVFKRHRAEMAAAADYANLETDEKDVFDSLMLAHEFFKNSPLGKAAVERKERQEAAEDMVPDDEGPEDGDDGEHPAPDFD